MADNLYDYLNQVGRGIKNFLAPPGYVSRGPLGSLPGGRAARPSVVGVRSDQLPRGAYMTEPGRVFGVNSTQVGRAGGYMDEMGRVFLPSNNQVTPSSWGAPSPSSGSTPGGRRTPGSSQTPTFVSSPAEERAYQAEVSRVAQLTAQDPELQRYEKARELAIAPGATADKVQSAEDIGMQMWAKANPTLAAKVKPGQSGYDVIQRTLGAGQMGSPMNFGFDASNPLATTPPVAAPSYAGVTPASLPGATPLPSNAFSGMVTTPYDRFNAGQTLASAPLGMPGAQIPGTYEGATGVQGMGASLGATPPMFNPSDEKAKALLEAFKNKQFGVQK